MKFSNLLTLLAVGVGGYLLYENYLAPTAVVTTSNGVPVTSVGSGTPVTTPASAGTNQTVAPTTLQLVANAVSKDGGDPNGRMSFDQWNYYFAMVRGVPGPDPASAAPSYDRNYLYSITEWWGKMTNAGFSGLRGVSGGFGGLGLIADVNPHRNMYTPGKGNGLVAQGIERYTKVM